MDTLKARWEQYAATLARHSPAPTKASLAVLQSTFLLGATALYGLLQDAANLPEGKNEEAVARLEQELADFSTPNN